MILKPEVSLGLYSGNWKPYEEDLKAFKEFNYTKAYQEYGNEKYLASGETFEQVVRRDAEILRLHNATREELAQSLRRLFSTYNEFLSKRAQGSQHPLPGIKLGRHYFELGAEGCPYLRDVSSNIDWIVGVEGLPNGNKAYHPIAGPTFVSDMLPTMIEQLGFFEGNVFYGIRPEWAIAVHNMVKGAQLTPYVPRYEKRTWRGFRSFPQSWEGKRYDTEAMKSNYASEWIRQQELRRIKSWNLTEEQLDFLYPPKEIMRHSILTARVTPSINAHVATGDLDIKFEPWSKGFYTDGLLRHQEKCRYIPDWEKRYPYDDRRNEFWGVLVAEEETVLPPDAQLMDMPFDAYVNRLAKGEILVISMFPYTEKLVG